MASSSSDFSRFLRWPAPPPRPFPAQVWLAQRYPFRVPPLVFATWRAEPPETAARHAGRRPFPAKVWLEQRQAGG